MKKFATRLLLFVVIFLIYDKLFIILARKSAEAEVDKRLEYLVNGEINKDIIVTGSSRGSRDIIAGQIEEATGLSTYNLCYPGSNVEFHEFLLRTLVEFNEAPEILLLVVDDYTEVLFDITTNFRKDRLYPLVKYPHIWRELGEQEGKDRFFSNFLILNKLNKYNFDIRKKQFTPLDTIMDCGSMPISWQREGRSWIFEAGERIYPLEKELPEKVNTFQRMIETCHAHQITLVLVFPPNYQSPSESFENRMRELGGEGVFYCVYDKENPIYRNKDYYYDEDHLMRKAAVVFTDEVIHFLNSLKKELQGS